MPCSSPTTSTTVRYLDRLIAAARERGAVFNFAGLSMMRAVVHYARGAIREAEADADARTALDVLPHRRVWFAPHVHGWSAQILVERGAVDEAAELLQAGEQLIAADADAFERTPLLRGSAMVLSARGDFQGALVAARAFGETMATTDTRIPASHTLRGARSRPERITRSDRPTKRSSSRARTSSSRASGARRARSAARSEFSGCSRGARGSSGFARR